MNLFDDRHRLERGATALAVLGIAAAVAAVFLPWDAGNALAGESAETGLSSGWGLLSLVVTVAVAVLLGRVGDWSRTAYPTMGAGVALVAVALVSMLVFRVGTGSGVLLTIPAGLTLALGGAVGAASARGAGLPRPLAELPVSRSLTGTVGAAGSLLVVGHLVLEVDLQASRVGQWPGVPITLGLFALAGLVGGLRAWSRPVASVFAVVGIVATVMVVASWQLSPPWWTASLQYSPLDGALVLVGGLALLLSGLLELGGAGSRAESAD